MNRPLLHSSIPRRSRAVELLRGRVVVLGRALGAMAFVFGLVTLSACGVESGGADESESSEAAPTTGRTGGIFGGSVQPRASRDAAGSSSAPLSTPDGSSGSRSGSGGAPAGSGTGGGASGSDEQGQVTAGEFDVTDMGYTVGAPDAPIQVIEFSDFGCGFCRRFHLNTYPALHEEYVETDRVAWKYIPFVLGIFPNGEEAAIAGECVLRHGRRSFPEFRNRLFEDQGAWRDSDDPASVFVEVGSEAGVDPAPLRRCIEEEGTAEQVRANNAVGQRIGLRGTPSFLINGFPLHGAQPAMVFRNIFDDMLRQAR